MTGASIASCLWFMCTVMDTPEHARSEIRNIMDSVIWRQGNHLVKHSVCCMPQSMGGFKKMDVDIQLQARRASWGQRFLDPACPGRWVHILVVREWLREGGLDPTIWVDRRSRRNLIRLGNSNLPNFWVECIKAMWGMQCERDQGFIFRFRQPVGN